MKINLRKIMQILPLILGIVFMLSCKKGDSGENPPVPEPIPNEIEVERVISPSIIEPGETVNIEIRLARPSGYKGKIFMRYAQEEGFGVGSLIYNGRAVVKGELVELTTDIVSLRYTAVTHYFHRLDFTFHSITGESASVSVALNKDLEGIDDYQFTLKAIHQSDATYLGITPITLIINPSPLYNGNYYYFWSRKSGNGSGSVMSNGGTLVQDQAYRTDGLTIELFYMCAYKGYNQVDFTVYDDGGRLVKYSAIFTGK